MKRQKAPNKIDIKIGDKFIVNDGYTFIFERHITDVQNKGSQILKDGTILESMLNKPFSYYNPKVGEVIEISDLEKSLTPGHSDSRKLTIKIGDNYFSTQWGSLKDMIK